LHGTLHGPWEQRMITAFYASVAKGKRTDKEYRAMKPKVQKFFQDKP